MATFLRAGRVIREGNKATTRQQTVEVGIVNRGGGGSIMQ